MSDHPAGIDRLRAEAQYVADRSCCYVGARRDHDVHVQIDRAVRSLLPPVCRACALRRLRTHAIVRFCGRPDTSETPMPDPLTTMCRGCLRPVKVTIIPAESGDEYRIGASWYYDCPECEWAADADSVFPGLHHSEDAPPPPDPLTVLLPILRHIGIERIAAALREAP